MNYQVWLHARHPKTLETVATVRIYAHTDRLRAEAVLENAQADHQPLVLALLQVHPGALVNAEMRHHVYDETIIESRVYTVTVQALRRIAGGAFSDGPAMAREALAQIGITE